MDLRDLMVVVLFTPVLYWMIRRFRIWFLVFLGILLFLPSWMGLRFEFLAKAFFFFSFGAYMSISRKDMILSFRSFFKWSLALYPLLGVLYIVVMDFSEVARVVKLLNTFAALFLAYNLAAWLLEKSYVKVNPFFAAAGFFIYVSHALILTRVLKVFLKIVRPDTGFGAVMLYAGTELAVVLSLLALFAFMRRYCPGLLKVMTGRK